MPSRRFTSPVTLTNFLAGLSHTRNGQTVPEGDVVGTCSFQPVSPIVTKAQALTKRNTSQQGELTSSEYPITECDGKYNSSNFPHGHNATVPCGAYGCICKYSPGKCSG